MSYNHRGQYQQPTPNQQYPDQYGQYPPQPSPGLNGGYQQGQYAQQPQQPGQQQYDAYGGSGAGGGPVQQVGQGGYHDAYSPRATSFGGGYGSQSPQPPYQYNPQHYAPSHAQSPAQPSIPQYNPAAYAQSPPTQYPPQPYGYTPPSAYQSSFSPQQPTYQPSPPATQQQFNYTQPAPSHAYSYPDQQHALPLRQQPVSAYGYGQSSASAPYPTEPVRQHTLGVGHMQAPQHGYTSVSPALPGLSDQPWAPSPPQYTLSQADTRQSPSPLYPSVSHPSLPSPQSSSTPGPTPPAHSHAISRSNTLDRHPQARPLPGPPDPDGRDYFQLRNGSQQQLSHEEEEAMTQEELFSQVENAVLNAGSGADGRGRSPSISVTRPPYDNISQPIALFAPTSPHLRRNGSTANGHLSPTAAEHPQSDESDAEGAQGLAMLREAEQDDFNSSGRFSYGSMSGPHSRTQSQQQALSPRNANATGGASDSDDYGTYDMSSFGGPDVRLSYGGNDPTQLVTQTPLHMPMPGDPPGSYDAYSQPVSSQHSSMRRSHASQSSQISRTGDYNYGMDTIHPFPPFNPAARVEVGGTGGLSEPTGHGRRQSYDEGDEYVLMEGQLPERFPDEPPDIFFQQALTTYPSNRPLPAVPGAENIPPLQTDIRQSYPHAPDAYGMNAAGQWVPRSTSMISHQTTPQISQPLRSKTDAEERRLKIQALRHSNSLTPTFESTPSSSVVPDLPSLGAKRFIPAKLGAPDFNKCDEPWSLMGMLRWLFQVIPPEQYTELKEAEVKDALVALFTNKVPTMNIADAEGLSNHAAAEMYTAGALITTEEWVKLFPAPISGVIYQLTGHGCYSPTLHDHIIPGRCYSRHCQRTLKKVNLLSAPGLASRGEDWATFYHLKKEDIEGKSTKEIERQNVLHEMVQTEEIYMEQLSILRMLYRDALFSSDPSIISPKRRDKFVKDVFGRVDAVKQANEDHLLPQLKYRQQEQGPWIIGFSDIFRQWIRKAKVAYLDYSSNFPGANFLVRQELERNLDFRAFIDRVSKDKRSQRLQWDTFLKAPITRLQRYTLLLVTVMKNMRGDDARLDEEKRNLQVAYEEIKAVTLECDARVAEMQRKVDLSDLSVKLVLRPGMQQAVELNLDHIGRMLIHRGELQRMGGNRFTWLDSHALLFDHYMVIAKTVARTAELGGKSEKYDVSRLPIPMDLLILESANEPAVQKSSYVKGITSVTTVTGRTADQQAALARTASNNSPNPGALAHVNTGASTNSLQTVTSLEGKDSDRIMYPFKIKHLGRETYTLFAPTDSARREWCTKIIEAKTKHAAALYAQHAEPFKIRVMADSAFVFDGFAAPGNTGQKGVTIHGTPVDRAIKEVEHRFKDTGRPGPICRARVNCATAFTMGEKSMVAVGTDFGVFVSEMENPRGWNKSIPMVKVTQIAVLEEFNLFLLIADKTLVAYHLDVVCPTDNRNGPATSNSNNDSARKAPQKLSGSRDVGLFAIGRQKDRTLVFYKKRENLNSVFKVLEPIYQKSTEKRSRTAGLFKRGTYEFFREFDEFYIPTECTGMNLFQSSLAVSTSRGFEVLTLDKKNPLTVPDLRAPEVQNIASHIKDQRALGMLRLSDQEFLLCYSNCAVYVNKHGEVSRSVIMDFVGNAQNAALYGAYLILFDSDFVEIRNAQNGRLKQIIAGREIKCLDDGAGTATAAGVANGGFVNGPSPGGGAGKTVKFVMQHPELERTQIVVELLLNENMKE
ncbi:Rho guanine nucleotide exchange factor [Recurvomyces mirabilis]|uniref:Rho guanine nucleotide exchange factor n=1 Tax=Recurvomyces mirabilis TaxID=574656 RepID=A0AAE1C3P2_9PEZI|nr:Rho guanine nucleotide exchange factor [Recurvomyces mirabilis]KAK5157006.1 Rho guanine nucleotide exchange factor [Recurvomyces mirabilis]